MADGRQYRTRGIPQEWVEIGHAGIDGTTKVAPQSLPHWEARGWFAVADAQPAEQPAAEQAPAPAPVPSKAPRGGVTGSES